MQVKLLSLGTLACTVILFFWSGLTQMFPWGVPSAKVYSTLPTDNSKSFQTPNLNTLSPNSLTTKQFDELLLNEVNTLETEKTFSWIVTKPASYYNPTHYFIREIVTQLVVSLFLTVIAIFTASLSIGKRLFLFLLMGLAGTVATYGQLWNWWGLTNLYAWGVSFNLVLGWLLSGFVLTKFVVKSTT